jgi:hypothetical protein
MWWESSYSRASTMTSRRLVSCITVSSKVRYCSQQIMFSVKPHALGHLRLLGDMNTRYVAYPFLAWYSYVTWSKCLARAAHRSGVGVCKSAIKLVSLGHFCDEIGSHSLTFMLWSIRIQAMQWRCWYRLCFPFLFIAHFVLILNVL